MENKPVQPETNQESTGKKLGKSSVSLFKRLFSRDKTELSALEEEAIQTPGMTILKNFFRHKLGILGLVVFIGIVALCVVGTQIWPIDLSYSETIMRNIRPGRNYLDYPSKLEEEGVEQLSSGVSFSVALSKAGNVYVWGTEPSYIMEDYSTPVLQIPQEVRDADIQHIAAGDRHVIALDSQNNLYGWGVNNFGQVETTKLLRTKLAQKNVAQLYANEMYSGVLFEDGEMYNWGSTMVNRVDIIPEEYQGRIKKVSDSGLNVALLLEDGTVGAVGVRGNPFSQIPEKLTDGSVNIVDIAASYRAVAALDDQGELHIWGDVQYDVLDIPEYEGNIVGMEGSKNNLTLLLDTGEVVYWGADHYGQLDMPRAITGNKAVDVYSDFFQNYAVMEDGSIVAWGNDGFLFGSDEMGRDIATRVIHGGRISLQVGAIAVVVSTVLALLVGMTSGFLGGFMDHLLMRFADIVQSIPFLPLAITLSAVAMGHLPESLRVNLIMMIIGFLGWTGLACLVRAQILLEREKDFVLAARALGVKQRNIVLRHILPNVFNLVIVNVTLSYAIMILQESALSFLGFGVKAPNPSWGNMLTGAQTSSVIRHFWWRWIIPGSFVVLAALSINLVGDALREAMDPRANVK